MVHWLFLLMAQDEGGLQGYAMKNEVEAAKDLEDRIEED
jgi:hypothetical protein